MRLSASARTIPFPRKGTCNPFSDARSGTAYSLLNHHPRERRFRHGRPLERTSSPPGAGSSPFRRAPAASAGRPGADAPGSFLPAALRRPHRWPGGALPLPPHRALGKHPARPGFPVLACRRRGCGAAGCIHRLFAACFRHSRRPAAGFSFSGPDADRAGGAPGIPEYPSGCGLSRRRPAGHRRPADALAG